MARSKNSTRALSEPHENFLVELLGGVKMPGSGNQAGKGMDGRHQEGPLRWSWDGKATRNASISIPLAMWHKAVEQADEARPALGLRWCDPHGDSVQDLIVVDAEDFRELREMALELLRLQEEYDFT